MSCITKEVLSGQYRIHRPHQPHDSSYHMRPVQSDSAGGPTHDRDGSNDNGTAVDAGDAKAMDQDTQHVFEVVIEGVRDLFAFTNAIWGEADCFVQYHFPKQLQQTREKGRQKEQSSTTAPLSNDDIELHPYRTTTTLCTPDPSFSHETRHILTLGIDNPVQKVLMSCYRAGGMGIELWKRFYYPNVRDQLIAKVSDLISMSSIVLKLFIVLKLLNIVLELVFVKYCVRIISCCNRQLYLLPNCVHLSQCGGQLLLVSNHSVSHLP